MRKIKPIETPYKGYRFRSRLEARWAVFFETLGVTWEYEKEGFNLGEDGFYLPDFRIPEWDAWIEIKSNEPEKGYLIKPTAFALLDGINLVLLFMGNPWPGEHTIENLTNAMSPDENHLVHASLLGCRRCNGICLAYDKDEETGFEGIGTHSCEYHDKWPCDVGRRLLKSFSAARAARFEHGESPGRPRKSRE